MIGKPPYYFIGIGGAGMSALAFYLIDKGREVWGSDLKETLLTQQLQAKGARIFLTQDGSGLPQKGTVIYSSAILPDHKEIALAQKRRLTILHRSELLGSLTRTRKSICITGTHGKSTLTAMTGWIFVQAGLNPSLIVGAVMKNSGRNYSAGEGVLICEADESDGSHLNLSPYYAVVTNVDSDHLAQYRTLASLEEALAQFCRRALPQGKVFLSADPHNLHLPSAVSYGREGDYRYDDVRFTSSGTSFVLYHRQKRCGHVRLPLIGEHNVCNATGAAALALEWGIEFEAIAKGLETFQGIARRQELIGQISNICVYDDYGHHPTEIKATLAAFRVFQKPIVVIFQPHRYSRTQTLLTEFPKAFSSADRVILTPIYSAGEAKIEGLEEQFRKVMTEALSEKVCSVESFVEAIDQAWRVASQPSILVTMGAGDVVQCAHLFLERGQDLGGGKDAGNARPCSQGVS